jgi:Carboxypeptidase regulatory-like domain
VRHILCAAILALPLFGQVSSSLSGAVTDPDGAAVAGATVRARGVQNDATAATTVTSRDGKYTLKLPPGKYEVSANGVPAMGEFDRKDVVVDAKPATLNIVLNFNTQLGTLGEDRVNLAADALRHKPPSGATPRTKDGKPDFSGVWWRPTDVSGGAPQFLPAAEAVAQARRNSNNKDNPQARCLPGVVLRFGPLFEMVQNKDYLVVINDDESPGFHQVYLNRAHPPDPNPAWYGHNVATWDGDTLVVDRVAFDERIWLDMAAHPHSPALHIVERYRRPDLGHLESEVTVEDPGVLSKPYTIKRVADLAQGYDIYEFICAENERDVRHMVGK